MGKTLLVKNIPDKLFGDFLRKIRGKYPTRSEAIRQLMRNFVEGGAA